MAELGIADWLWCATMVVIVIVTEIKNFLSTV